MAELENPILSKHQATLFADRWKMATAETQLAESFWRDFFRTLCGVDDAEIAGIEFQKKVISSITGNTEKMDFYWKNVAIIEHKSTGENLDKAELQARGYLRSLPPGYRPRTIIICDFANFRLIDVKLNRTHQFTLTELPNNIHRFESIISGSRPHALEEEITVDQRAAKLMANLYIELESHGYEGHETSVFLIRILFLMFGDDTRMWEHNFVKKIILDTKEDGSDIGKKLNMLFKVLNTPTENRAKNLETQFRLFPFVNGGIFAEDISEIGFDRRMRVALIDVANYNWATINPTIFGAMFQMIKSKEERGALGEHYTSEENINKIVHPLFLEELGDRLARAWDSRKALKELRRDLSKIKIFDPACGCGNFLVVSFRHLRQLELELTVRLQNLEGKESDVGLDGTMGLSVGLHQFYGIEILEWPAQVARMALFLADHQENLRLERITGEAPSRFPIQDSPNIFNGNALTSKWSEIIAIDKDTYILGNPPFVGARLMNDSQKEETRQVWNNLDGVGNLDYVANWFLLCAKAMAATGARAALVSTNSTTHGVQPPVLWQHLFGLGIHIDFAHRTFSWENESEGMANVHVVIIGFLFTVQSEKFKLWSYETPKGTGRLSLVKNINAYLLDAPNVFINSRRAPLRKFTQPLLYGSQPNDGGAISDISDEEASNIRRKDPIAAKYLKRVVGARELLHDEKRWCLWMIDVVPSDIQNSPELRKRISAVKKHRESSTRKATQELASTPHLFGFISHPAANYLAVPLHSSEDRYYVPIAFFDEETVCTNAVSIVPEATIETFAVMCSSAFNVWNKAVSGRLESRVRISSTITYNNFPFPKFLPEEKKLLKEAGKHILEVRHALLGQSLADMYGKLSIPLELLAAHQAVDAIVLKHFGLKTKSDENDILSTLFKEYESLVGETLRN